MYRRFLFILILFFARNASLLADCDDSLRISRLNDQAIYYQLTEPSRSLRYLDQAFDLAIATNCHSLRIKTLVNIASVYEIQQNWEKSIAALSEAAKLSNQFKQIIYFGQIHEQLGAVYTASGNYKLAYSHYQIARSYYLSKGLKADLIRILNSISILFQLEGSYGKALRFAFESLQISERISNKEGMAGSLGNLAMIYYLLGDQEKSLFYYDRAIKVTGLTDNAIMLAQYYCSQGFLLSEMGKNELAIMAYLNALQIYNEAADYAGMMVVLNNIGQIYVKSGDFSKALNYFQRARQLSVTLLDNSYWMQMTESISNAYAKIGNLKQAERELKNALDRAKELGNREMIARIFVSLGSFYYSCGDYINAKISLESVISDPELFIHDEDHALGLSLLSNLYELEGNFKSALAMYKRSKQMTDSLQSNEKYVRFELLKSAFNSESRQNEKEMLKFKAEVEKLQKDKAVFIRNMLVISLFTILLMLVIILNRLLVMRRRSKLLNYQKAEIEFANQKLRGLNNDLDAQGSKMNILNEQLLSANMKLQASEEHLRALNSTKDKFFSIISHDLRNPFASIVSFSRIMKRDLHLYSTEEIKELAQEMDKSISQINNLLENLLQWSRNQAGNMPFKPELIKISHLVSECFVLLEANAKAKEISLISDSTQSLSVIGDFNMLSTIIRNLVMNAIKYSHYGQSVVVSASIDGAYTKICVKDSGVGISKENLQRIFSQEERFSTYGTADEKGSGLGLILCREFVEKHMGKLEVESVEGSGTVFSFSILNPNENEAV